VRIISNWFENWEATGPPEQLGSGNAVPATDPAATGAHFYDPNHRWVFYIDACISQENLSRVVFCA
jgi:hypothetical protein